MKLSVIMPVYNEVKAVETIINKVKEVPVDKEIIVVDDFSTDGTREKLSLIPGIKLLFHPKNMGKGAAIRTGIREAKGDIVVIQDADLEYDPWDYLKLVRPFQDQKVCVVYGSRFKGKGDFLFLSKLANRFLSILTNILFGKVSDMETCYKLVRREIFLGLNLTANRFEIEPEITAKLLRKKVKIVEVPIKYQARKIGKKIGVKDGIAACYYLFKWYLR
ncbi:MAG: glycosyltransferase family 2 protein [candidate division WOR-3 bacterium]|nr:glycosyltransferase family 2 protein [candidate division WOR-3 bacterium]